MKKNIKVNMIGFFFFFYLFIWLLQVLVSSMQDIFIMACKLLEAYGIYFPDWG